MKIETAPDQRLLGAGFERIYRMARLVPGDPDDGSDGDFLWRDPEDDVVLTEWQALERLANRAKKGRRP